MKLCKVWGRDERKRGRDLGEYIQERVMREFREGEMSVMKDPDECEKKVESLERLARNTYYQETDGRIVPSTGLTQSEIAAWTSTEMIEGTKHLSEGSQVGRIKIAVDYYKNRLFKIKDPTAATHEDDSGRNGSGRNDSGRNDIGRNDTKKLPSTESRSKSEDTK